MTGKAAAGGFQFQAQAIAYAMAYMLADTPLGWIGDADTPMVVAAETGGPGDDFSLQLTEGRLVEIQAKRGLNKTRLWPGLLRLCQGLAADPILSGVLVVDQRTSQTIREDLKADVQRIAEGMPVQPGSVGQEFVEHLHKAGISDFSFCSRLFIITRDLDTGGSGQAAARQVLAGSVVNSPKDAVSTWAVLEHEAHELMKRAGRTKAQALLQQLSQHHAITLSSKAENLAVMAERYAKWMRQAIENLHFPGLDIALPIGDGWAELDAMPLHADGGNDPLSPASGTLEEYYAAAEAPYREGDKRVFQVRYLLETRGNLVLVGGPAAGKTTALRRMAYDLCSAGNSVFLVRLASLQVLMRQQGTFDRSLAEAASEGSGLAPKDVGKLIESADYLFLDGLDECGPERAGIAEAISKWALGHPGSRIVVATRTVGHTPALLPRWRSVRLLPLAEEAVKAHAERLLKAKGNSKAQAETRVKRITGDRAGSAAKQLIEQSPLLLDFVLALELAGKRPDRSRTRLYANILILMDERGTRQSLSHPQIMSPLARRILETLAWHSIPEPNMARSELVSVVAATLASESGVSMHDSLTQVEQAIVYWQTRRVIELLRTPTHEAIGWVHRTLRDYIAACFISELDGPVLAAWLEEALLDPAWRDVLALVPNGETASTIVERLLQADSVKKPNLEALGLAAQISAEPDRRSSAQKVAHRLVEHLDGQGPKTALSAVGSAAQLGRAYPDVVLPLVLPLCRSDLPWVRVGAVRLALLCDQSSLSADEVVDFLAFVSQEPPWFERSDYNPARRHPKGKAKASASGVVYTPSFVSAERDIHSQATTVAVKALLGQHPEQASREEALLASILDGAGLNAGAAFRIRDLLFDSGYRELVQKSDAKEAARYGLKWNLEYFEASRESSRRGDQSLLKLIGEAASGLPRTSEIPRQPRENVRLAKVIRGLGWPEAPLKDWTDSRKQGDPAAVIAVVQALMTVLGVDPVVLQEEVALASAELKRIWSDSRELGLLSALPNVPLDPDWNLLRDQREHVPAITRAVDHPSLAISRAAKGLLEQFDKVS